MGCAWAAVVVHGLHAWAGVDEIKKILTVFYFAKGLSPTPSMSSSSSSSSSYAAVPKLDVVARTPLRVAPILEFGEGVT